MDFPSCDTEQEQHKVLTILLHIPLSHFEFWTLSNKFQKLYKVQFLICFNQHVSRDDGDLTGMKRQTHRHRAKPGSGALGSGGEARAPWKLSVFVIYSYQGHGVVAHS